MVRLFLLHFILFLVACSTIEPSPKTIVHNPAEAEKLLGTHLFTTDFVSKLYLYFGEASIKNKYGVYYIDGKHERIDNTTPIEYQRSVRMNGTVLEISDFTFTFQGTIETFDTMYELCTQTGTFEFSRKSHPKYWRYKMACSEHIEAVDLFTKHK